MLDLAGTSLALKEVEFVGADFQELENLFLDKLAFRPSDNGSDGTVLVNGGAFVRLVPGADDVSYIARHGTSIRQISFLVPDVEATVGRAEGAGAKVLVHNTDDATIEIYPGLTHRLFPQTAAGDSQQLVTSSFPVIAIDHLAICLPEHDFGLVTDRYREVFGLHTSHEEYVATGVSAMNSVVLTDEREVTKLVFMQPQDGPKKSQIQTFIDEFGGAGVQHIAFEVKDIVQAANFLIANGIEMLQVPQNYYDELKAAIEQLPYPLEKLRDSNVLVDEDSTGQLLQAFTKPVFERKTVFIELVERRGNTGFGSGNIKSLFKAVEREMANAARQ